MDASERFATTAQFYHTSHRRPTVFFCVLFCAFTTDLRLMLQMLLGQVPVDLKQADLDGNGQLSLADLRALIELLVGR